VTLSWEDAMDGACYLARRTKKRTQVRKSGAFWRVSYV
jgi:hypothetical protein